MEPRQTSGAPCSLRGCDRERPTRVSPSPPGARARQYREPVQDHLPQSVRVERRPVDESESRRANGPDWDRYADEYQATHGEFLGDAGFVWGPEGQTEEDLGILGDVAGRDVLEVGSGAGQCSRWVRNHGGRAVGLDLSHRQLQHSRRIDEITGVVVPSVRATATHLPFADDTFDVVFCSFGALQFVHDIEDAVDRDRPGAPPRRALRLLDHAPDAVDVPRRPRRRRPGRLAVLLGPHAVRRGRRRVGHGRVRRAPPHARRLGAPALRDGLRPARPRRARVARRPRPGVGRLVPHPRPAHPRHRDLRGRPARDSGG